MSSTPLIIFEIPHIQDDICAYLTRDTLTRCVLVSHLWTELFTPYLYRTIDLSHTKTLTLFKENRSAAALVRYRDMVQVLKTSAMNQVMLGVLQASVATTTTVAPEVSSTLTSVLLLPKSMHSTLDGWKFTNLRHFEWTYSKWVKPTTTTTSLSAAELLAPSSWSNLDDPQYDGSMAALQLILLHTGERLETVSLRFRILSRQHVRILLAILRGPHRLRKVFVEYHRADVLQSVLKRLTWTALSLKNNNSRTNKNTNNSDGDGDTVHMDNQLVQGESASTLESFHMKWSKGGQLGWDQETDSEIDDDDDDYGYSDDDNNDGDGIEGEQENDNSISNGSISRRNDSLLTTTTSTTDDVQSPPSPSLDSPSYHRPRQSRIKDLGFRFDKNELESVILAPLLERCPQLESLSIWSISSDALLEELPELLADFCPRLKRLGVGEIYGEDAEISQLIAGCGQRGLQEDEPTSALVRPTTTAVTKSSGTGLQSFKILSMIDDFDEISVLALGRYHGASLSTLDFSNQTRFPTHLFLRLINQCPHLRVLRCNIELCKEHQSQPIDYTSLFSQNWPFAATLKTLDLVVYRGSDLEIDSNYRHGDGSISDRYIDYLYTQVGRLHKLEEWHLGGWMILLKVDWGLDKLAGLKGLKVLDVRQHTFIKWTKDEIEWMALNWTGLVEIWGVKSPNLQLVIHQLKILLPTIEIL
ncbi:hypothetical protein BGX29_010499 [Mortierella sp. GBA35]|nr:hypothetical protein BGX29_010499 [Mortierella sp. GBA35]